MICSTTGAPTTSRCSRACASSGIAGRRRATASAISWRAARSPIAGSTSRAMPRRRRLLALAGGADAPLPVVILADGSALSEPSIEELGDRLGIRKQAQSAYYDMIVVGTGPAGTGGGGLWRLGGSAHGADRARGARRAGGHELADRELSRLSGGAQRRRSGAARAWRRRGGSAPEILAPVEAVKLETRQWLPHGDAGRRHAARQPGADGRDRRVLQPARRAGCRPLRRTGLFYGAAITEAIAVKDQDVFVVGSGNSAGQAAIYLVDSRKRDDPGARRHACRAHVALSDRAHQRHRTMCASA